MREWIVDTAFALFETISPILGVAFLAIFFVFIPLGLFDSTRGFAAISLYVISLIFGFTIWVYSAGVAFGLLGWFWLIVGLLLAGLGVVLIAFLGAIFHGYFSLAFGIAISALFPLLIRFIAIYLDEKEQERNRKNV